MKTSSRSSHILVVRREERRIQNVVKDRAVQTSVSLLSSGGSSFKVFILPPLTGKENLFQGQPLFVSLLIKDPPCGVKRRLLQHKSLFPERPFHGECFYVTGTWFSRRNTADHGYVSLFPEEHLLIPFPPLGFSIK